MTQPTVTLLIPSQGHSAAARPGLAGMLVKRPDGRVNFSAVDVRLARACLTAVGVIQPGRVGVSR
jgi:hypothetical protein